MDKSQLELRRAAAQAFMESLDQLEKSLIFPESESSDAIEAVLPPVMPCSSPPEIAPEPVTQPTLQELAAAAADIEQFIKAQEEE